MKAILLVRVSTEQQTLDEQTQNLIDYAINKGYEQDNHIIIKDKESAIKLDEHERRGLNEMKSEIAKDKSINAVFVWELSRLTRRAQMAYSLRDYFIDNKIQLYCKSPEFQLLKDDLSELDYNQGGIMFGLFISMAEAETANRKARFHRSKKRNAKNGKYSGGFIKFGYKVNGEGYYVINEEEAELIRYIFNEYESGRSTMNIQKELLKRGKCNGSSFVRETLICEAYTGLSNKYKMERKYPQIISSEQFTACRRIAKFNNKRADKTNETYFAKKLIKCVECGTHYIGMKSSIQYVCYGRYGKEAKLSPNNACKASASININVLDSLLWRLAKFSEATRSDYIDIKEKENLVTKLAECKKHINESELSKTKLIIKKERIADNYMDGIIDKNKRNIKIKEVDKLMNETNNYIITKQNEIRKANTILKTKFKTELSEDEYINYLKNEIITKKDALELITDDNEKYEIIKKNIKEINVVEGELHKSKIVVIKYYNNKEERYRVNIKKKPAIVESDVIFNTDEYDDENYDEEINKQFHDEWDEEPFTPIVPTLEITKRFIRKKQSKNI